jgi:hypothetical protein
LKQRSVIWDSFVAGSVPLKLVIKGGGAFHAVVLTATSVKEEKLDDKSFYIPKFKQIIKAPY